MRQTVTVVGLVFVVALAVVVGRQMSTEAMAVVIGVVCGVVASIPTSVLLLAALTRRERARVEEEGRQGSHDSAPPVVVIQGGGSPGLPMIPPSGYWPMPTHEPAAEREFRIVGGDDLVVRG
jgi:hypothetical protein